MANLFVDVKQSNAKPTLFLYGNCFLYQSTVSEYSLYQMLLRVVADGSTSLAQNAQYQNCVSRFDIAFN
jgi:hypothetical protein